MNMNDPITHIMVLVVPEIESLATQLAATQLASSTGALVTLLHVDDRGDQLQITSQLDAIENLHRVLLMPRQDTDVLPAYSEVFRRAAIKRLDAMRDRLAALSPEGVDIRVAYRRGDAHAEVCAFIDEAGVDVVFIQSAISCRNATLRRLTKSLQRQCKCQIQIVHPPGTKASKNSSLITDCLNFVVARLRKQKLPLSPDLLPSDA